MKIKLWQRGNSRNLNVFNFAILVKSHKFDAREISVFYSSQSFVGILVDCCCVTDDDAVTGLRSLLHLET